jgi:hypothetical protein
MTDRSPSAVKCALIAVVVWVVPILARQAGNDANAFTLSAPTHHQFDDRFALEPMLVEHPSGALFVSGYGSLTPPSNIQTPNLWKSTDGGRTFVRVTVGTTGQGALGNSDVDLAMAPDGTLYFVSMTFDNKAHEGVNINVGVSHDVGVTWKWTQLSNTRWDDRPWVEVAPDGTAHVIWNDGAGVSHAVSTDRGETWAERPRVHPQGGSSHLAVGPKGEIAVRITPVSASGFKHDPKTDFIAVSVDAGRTWSKHRAPGQRTWMFPVDDDKDPLPRWVEPIAWDAARALFSLWTDANGVHLARSLDLGKTWQHWLVVETKGMTAFFPYLVARGKGELAATWFTAQTPGYASLRAHVAKLQVSDGRDRPDVHTASFEIDASSGKKPTPGGEYVPVIFLRDGRLAVVTPVHVQAEKRVGFSYWTVGN